MLYQSFSILFLAVVVRCQFFDDDTSESEYKGKFIGNLNSYHHQVNGEVYAVDQHTLLIRNFVYDGNGKDTFFWAGTSNRPGPQGFIVSNEKGRTNVLDRYLNTEITVTLPDKKKIADLRWFSIYDLSLHDAFGDIYIPEDFEAPDTQVLSELAGFSNDIRAEEVVVMDSKSIKLVEFNYDGKAEGVVQFWVGVGPQPSSKGTHVPDELGYLEPIRAYYNEDVELSLPGELTIFDVRWFSVYDVTNSKDLGHIIIPDVLNVPPALVDVIKVETSLEHCRMLHSNLMISWSVFAPSITIQLSGLIDENEYMAFGVSNPQGESNMIGADAAVAYIDGYLGFVDDYNITAKAPCGGVLEISRGVCKDEVTGGISSNQIQSHKRTDGVTQVTFRKTLQPTSDPHDNEIFENKLTSVVWAIGRLAQKEKRQKEPSFHHTYARKHTTIDFGRKENKGDCLPFVQRKPGMMSASFVNKKNSVMHKQHNIWGPNRLFDPTLRTFDARLGPSGNMKGYSGVTGLPSTGYAWYINGYLVPELYLRRGLTYAFRVEGGKDPYRAGLYHPLVITSDPIGGYDRLTDDMKKEVRILAGVEFTRRFAARPTATGRLCLWKHREGADRRLDDNFQTFEKFRNSLMLQCEEGDAAILEVTPNITWPDVVYYQSYSQPYMGWKINIVDDFNKRYLTTVGNKADSTPSSLFVVFTLSIGALFL